MSYKGNVFIVFTYKHIAFINLTHLSISNKLKIANIFRDKRRNIMSVLELPKNFDDFVDARKAGFLKV